MIRSEELKEFRPGTEQLLFPYSARDFSRYTELNAAVLTQSDRAVAIYYNDELLCYAGLVRTSPIARPYLWFLLGKSFTRWKVKVLRKLKEEFVSQYGSAIIAVESTYAPGIRLAQFCGFRPWGNLVEHQDRLFQFYEVA